MVQIQKNRVIFSRDTWEDLRNNPIYTELIEDIEDRMELEKAINEHDKSGGKLIDFDSYDNKRMRKISNIKRASVKKLKKTKKVIV